MTIKLLMNTNLVLISDSTLIIFQKSIAGYPIGENVFVTAHTGCGKTVVAIYGIANSLKGKKVIYTSPTKSLSNQKYKEFSEKFNKTVLEFLLEHKSQSRSRYYHYDN